MNKSALFWPWATQYSWHVATIGPAHAGLVVRLNWICLDVILQYFNKFVIHSASIITSANNKRSCRVAHTSCQTKCRVAMMYANEWTCELQNADR